MKPHILFMVNDANEGEYSAAVEVWGDRVTQFRTCIPDGSPVIARYSCLPFFKNLEAELALKGCKLVNPYHFHNYIAKMQWCEDLRGMTPETWFNVGWKNAPERPHGYVVNGVTNSRKFKWNTHMRASTRDELKDVMGRLYDDPFIAEQGLVVREYVPLRQVEEPGINGMPVTDEWRVFFYGKQVITSGYYWAQAVSAEEHKYIPLDGLKLAEQAAKIVATRFSDPHLLVADVARTERGDWIVVELNDGQMSGLSMIEPLEFYRELDARF